MDESGASWENNSQFCLSTQRREEEEEEEEVGRSAWEMEEEGYEV